MIHDVARKTPVNFHCVCGTEASVSTSTGENVAWACPSCGRCWRADADGLSAALAATAQLRRLRTYLVFAVGLATVLAVVATVLQPSLLAGLLMAVGVLALIASPAYRKRIQHSRLASQTRIAVASS